MNLPLFWKHATTVLTGTVIAQALPVLASPLITRLCTPADLGEFSVWLGVIAITAMGATLRLEAAMILDHDSEEQQTCFSVVAYFSTVSAVLITFLAVLAHVLGLPQAQKMSWLGVMTIGLGVWLTAYNQVVVAYATSYRAFAKSAMAKICGAGTIAVGPQAGPPYWQGNYWDCRSASQPGFFYCLLRGPASLLRRHAHSSITSGNTSRSGASPCRQACLTRRRDDFPCS
jgi:O-antigen/teichoic acid export membrane protein